MKKLPSVVLSLMMVLLTAQPALSHELKIEEPDHPLQWVGVVFHPAGHLLYHLIFGWGHADTTSPTPQAEHREVQPLHEPMRDSATPEKEAPEESVEAEPAPESEQQATSPPQKPKYNFSPRKRGNTTK